MPATSKTDCGVFDLLRSKLVSSPLDTSWNPRFRLFAGLAPSQFKSYSRAVGRGRNMCPQYAAAPNIRCTSPPVGLGNELLKQSRE